MDSKQPADIKAAFLYSVFPEESWAIVEVLKSASQKLMADKAFFQKKWTREGMTGDFELFYQHGLRITTAMEAHGEALKKDPVLLGVQLFAEDCLLFTMQYFRYVIVATDNPAFQQLAASLFFPDAATQNVLFD
jgi:hypothetical protein